MTPKRIQRRRTKGWRMPEGAVYVGRPSRWGNPWRVGDTWCLHRLKAYDAASLFEHRARCGGHRYQELRGRDLACWCRLCPAHAEGKPLGVTCPDCEPCHADVLLEIANAPEEATP